MQNYLSLSLQDAKCDARLQQSRHDKVVNARFARSLVASLHKSFFSGCP